MAKVNYTPNVWKDKTEVSNGSMINAAAMTKIENGIVAVSSAVNELMDKQPVVGPQGLQGEVGPQGPAVAVVDDLTTGGTTEALSAEQGKAIKALIDSLTQKLTALETKVNQNHPS